MVISPLSLYVALTSKGLCPFLSSKGCKCPLATSYSSTLCWACRVFSNPVNVFFVTLSFQQNSKESFYALYATAQCPLGRDSHNFKHFVFPSLWTQTRVPHVHSLSISSWQSSTEPQMFYLLSELKLEFSSIHPAHLLNALLAEPLQNFRHSIFPLCLLCTVWPPRCSGTLRLLPWVDDFL
jgi:hypothetical protein